MVLCEISYTTSFGDNLDVAPQVWPHLCGPNLRSDGVPPAVVVGLCLLLVSVDENQHMLPCSPPFVLFVAFNLRTILSGLHSKCAQLPREPPCWATLPPPFAISHPL